jgi:hypothetical protein
MEPFTVGALGALTAAEAVKFLFGQATEVIGRWRDRRADRTVSATVEVAEADAAAVESPPSSLVIDFAAVDRLHEDIAALAEALADYASGQREVPVGDPHVAEVADALRRALEVVYDRDITLAGEDRGGRGPAVHGRADAETVSGSIAGVRAKLVRSGTVHGVARATDVSGTLSGVDADTIG